MNDTTKHIIGRNKNSTCTWLLTFRAVMEPVNSGESTLTYKVQQTFFVTAIKT